MIWLRVPLLLCGAASWICGQTADSLFQPLIPRIKAQWHHAIHLPSALPDLKTGQDRIYAVLSAATPSHYEVLLGFTADCQGETACRIGTVSADADLKKLSGKRVRLQHGIVGRFVDAKCGASCSDSTLTWTQDGASYTVGLKAGSLPDLRQMANSAIAVK